MDLRLTHEDAMKLKAAVKRTIEENSSRRQQNHIIETIGCSSRTYVAAGSHHYRGATPNDPDFFYSANEVKLEIPENLNFCDHVFNSLLKYVKRNARSKGSPRRQSLILPSYGTPT